MYNECGSYMRSPEGEGGLHINVFDNSEGKPLSNAEIKITPRGDRSNVLVDEFTNQSGQTRNS